ncbi:MAG: hypothetical protein H0X47_11910 [Nitrospirales bacterium]|nr:hypothetical protein [Nitrospirales bacterium]
MASSSAGALNGAYFITGQASYGAETYIHHLTKKYFVNPLPLKKMVVRFQVPSATLLKVDKVLYFNGFGEWENLERDYGRGDSPIDLGHW